MTLLDNRSDVDRYIDTAITEIRAMPSRLGFVRRRVVGMDVWVECPNGMNHAIDQARESTSGTHLRLVAALEGAGIRGASRSNEHAVLRLRFVARQDDSHITDEAVFELLARLPMQLHWSDLVKLEEFDGVPAYAPLPPLQ